MRLRCCEIPARKDAARPASRSLAARARRSWRSTGLGWPDGAVNQRHQSRQNSKKELDHVSNNYRPWLMVSSGSKALEYYRDALDAIQIYCLDGDDGRVVVAQLTVDGAPFWIQEDVESPESVGRPSVRLILTVERP